MNQISLKKQILYLLLFVIGMSIPGCEKTHDEPEVDPVLLVNSLNIALVKGGAQTVSVTTYDKYGGSDGFTVTSKNASVASVAIHDTAFIVAGVNYGSTTITITSNSGKSTEIPVRVYDLQVLDTDELLITFAQSFQFQWNDQGSGLSLDGSYYHPITTDGFKPLGSLGINGYYNPDGIHGVMVLKSKPGTDALAIPTDYTLVWSDNINQRSFWIPVPPTGYKAMGIVAQSGINKPNLDDVVCVREDLTVPGEAGECI